MAFTYKYPAHYVTVDPVIFGAELTEKTCTIKVLLIRRGLEKEPFYGQWALPGGFIRPEESLEDAVVRKLGEETGVTKAKLQQLYVYGDPKRDPRGRVLTVGYTALVDYAACDPRAGVNETRAEWFNADDLPKLAFDHADIVARGIDWLRSRIRYEPIGFSLLPPVFTIQQYKRLCEAILGQELHKPNFRRMIAQMPIFKTVGEEQDVSHRPAKLVSFDERKYERWVKQGNTFQV
jgi:8-oxo-dGTP diphosphatase